VVFENVRITAPKGLTVRNVAAVEFKHSNIQTKAGPSLILESQAAVTGMEGR